MKAIFDTSSFDCIIRNYIPIDRNDELKNLLKENFENGEFILIDKVYEQIQNYPNGLVFKEFPFLKNRSICEKTDVILPNVFFYNKLPEFVNQKLVNNAKKKLNEIEIELGIEKYLMDADGRILIFANSISSQNPIIITEETNKNNDGKLIRKIPYNCSLLNLNCCSISTLLKEKFSVNISK